METNREYLCVRAYKISEQFNISYSSVHTIIKEFIKYSKELLYSGKRIDFFDLVYIEPDIITDGQKTTLGYNAIAVSKRLGIPYYTVYNVIKEYLNSLKLSLHEGKTAEIRSLVTLHPYKNEQGVNIIHSAISITVKKELSENNYPINAARVHTYKSLKEEFANIYKSSKEESENIYKSSKEELSENNYPINAARVHTYKSLKEEFANAVSK